MTDWDTYPACCPFGDCPTCNPLTPERLREIRQQAKENR